MAESSTTRVVLPAGVTVSLHENEESWLEQRRQSIGASESAVILGLSRFKTPWQLFQEKLGLAKREAAETEAAEWGKILEGPIATRYAKETERPVEEPPPYSIIKRESRPIATATLDRLVWLAPVWAPLELKTAHFTLGKKWTEEIPLEYMVQVQHQMMVWGTAVASIAALIGGSTFVWADVTADPEFQEMLYAELEAFWKRLEAQEPPPIDGTPGTRELLKKLYAKDSGEVIALPSEAMEWDEKIAELKAQQKVIEEELARHENMLIQRLGTASAGSLPNGTMWTYKSQTRAAHMVKESTYRVLRRHAAKERR